MSLSFTLLVRSMIATPFRLLLVYMVIISLLHFDVSPLPLWTSDAISFLMQFVLMYAAAWWVMRNRATTWTHALLTFIDLFLFGMLLEVLLSLLLRGPSDILPQLVSLRSLTLYVVYAIAVSCAFWQVKRHSAKQVRLS